MIIGAWFTYSLARSLSGNGVATAVHRGRMIQNWDQHIGFGWTLAFNHWITAHNLFALPLSIEYASLHYLVTPMVLIWLWRAHPDMYRPALLSLLTMSAIGLVVYIVFPVAPPRLLPDSGWIDTMRSTAHFGWWGSAGSAPAGMGHFTDQFAAMPSLHVGWAVWCAWAWSRVSGPTVRRIAWIYPASVAITVIATANHYVLDVIAGSALSITVCLLLPRLLARWQNRERGVTRSRTPRLATGPAEDDVIDLRTPQPADDRTGAVAGARRALATFRQESHPDRDGSPGDS